MNKPIYVLWIEEETTESLESIRVELGFDPRVKLKVAGNAREAWEFLRWEIFDVIIVDIRIPPGVDSEWEEYAMDDEKLGLKLIEKIFDQNSIISDGNKDKEKYGVLTIERQKDIERIFISKKGPLKNENYLNKDHILDGEDMIEFILKIKQSSK